MLKKMEMFGCVCDSCEKQWVDDHTGFTAFTDKNSISEYVDEDTDWETIQDEDGEDFHFCNNCFKYYDDEDAPVFTVSAQKPPKYKGSFIQS